MEPIKKGDLAIVLRGMDGAASPNVGKIVRVGYYKGEHSLYGPVWEVHCEMGLETQFGTRPNADIPAKWLKKINPPQQTKEEQRVRELAHAG